MIELKAQLMYIHRYMYSMKFRIKRLLEFVKMYKKYNRCLNEVIKKDIIKNL